MNKAIFLDRDGTINVDYGYVYELDKLKFIDGVPESLKKLQDAGYLLIIITNQSGVGRGYYTIKDVFMFNMNDTDITPSGNQCPNTKHNDGTFITATEFTSLLSR